MVAVTRNQSRRSAASAPSSKTSLAGIFGPNGSARQFLHLLICDPTPHPFRPEEFLNTLSTTAKSFQSDVTHSGLLTGSVAPTTNDLAGLMRDSLPSLPPLENLSRALQAEFTRTRAGRSVIRCARNISGYGPIVSRSLETCIEQYGLDPSVNALRPYVVETVCIVKRFRDEVKELMTHMRGCSVSGSRASYPVDLVLDDLRKSRDKPA